MTTRFLGRPAVASLIVVCAVFFFSALGLSAEHRRLLKSAGATDLRSIARALQAAPTIESYNANVQLRQKRDRKAKAVAQPISFAISAAKADEIRRAISAALAKSLETKREG